MSTTTKKHESFIAGPMRNKGIKEVPGIGNVLGKKLIEDNITEVLLKQ